MNFRPILVSSLFLFPALTFAASREIVELQRDVALMQEQLRTLQRSQDEKLTQLNVLVQQTLDAANKANTSVAVLDNSLRQSLKEQEKNVVAPVAGVGTRIEQMTTDFQALRETVNDIAGRLRQAATTNGGPQQCYQDDSSSGTGAPSLRFRTGSVHGYSPDSRRHSVPECFA